MDHDQLRALLREYVGTLNGSVTHSELPALCARLGLPAPPPAEGISKRDRLLAAVDEASNHTLQIVAQKYIAEIRPRATVRNRLQDVIWSDDVGPKISKRIRRELAQALTCEDLYLDAGHFDALVASLWVVDDDPIDVIFGVQHQSLRAAIDRHVHKNPGDWTPEELFQKLGAYEASDTRFRLFLEGLASADVRPSDTEQRRFVLLANGPLRRCGAELRETGLRDGYPVFAVVSLGAGSAQNPKNIIFASPIKPDLRFRDAVNNDVEIVTNADKVLVYDQPVGSDGLRWRDLQEWWAKRQGALEEQQAKRTLYRRLLESLPPNSPPQRFLFVTFFKTFAAGVHDLPALLPEVWLHWDPKTAQERGPDALARFRMDFLMLLPYGTRVVIEVDGRHHFSRRMAPQAPSSTAQ